jgi:hypothetical protein
MQQTAAVVDLSKDPRTLREIVQKDIDSLPVYSPVPEGKRESRVNNDWYAAVIMRTRDYSHLQRIEVEAAAKLMRGDDKACYNPAVNPVTAILLMPGGKFIPETQPELIRRFEKQITDSVERVVRNVKGSSRRLEFIYFNYHEEHSTTPGEFAKAMDKMLEYL